MQLDQASGLHFAGTAEEFGDFTGAEEGIFSDIFYKNNDQILLSYSNGTIFIFSPENVNLSHAELYNSIGQLINIYDLNNQRLNEIHYSGSPGYYLVKICTDEFFSSKKIIIN